MSSPERTLPIIRQPTVGVESREPRGAATRKPPQRSFQLSGGSEVVRGGHTEADSDDQLNSLQSCNLEKVGFLQVPKAASEPSQTRDEVESASLCGDWPGSGRHPGTTETAPAAGVSNLPVRERLLNAREVASRLGVSERWVRDHTMRRSPKIRAVKLGTLMRYRPADIDAFMDHLDTLRTAGQSRFGV